MNEQETQQFRPAFEDVVSVDIMCGLEEFCGELSNAVLAFPSGHAASPLPLVESVGHLMRELSGNLNESIVRIEELQFAGTSLTAKLENSDAAMEHLEFRVNEIQQTMHQIDVVDNVLTKIEGDFISVYEKRLRGVRTSFDSESAVVSQLKRDPLRTIKAHGIKSIKQNGPKLKRFGRSLLQLSGLQFGGKHQGNGMESRSQESHGLMMNEESGSRLPVLNEWHELIKESEPTTTGPQDGKEADQKDPSHRADFKDDGDDDARDMVKRERVQKLSIDLP